MTTATVSKKRISANAPSPVPTQEHPAAKGCLAGSTDNKINLVALAAAAFAFSEKVAVEHYDRDDMIDGSHHDVKLHLAAEIDGGLVMTHSFEGSIDVGHSSVRASSTGPGNNNVVAWLLSKYNEATRESLLREMADACRANGGKLPVSEESEKAAEQSLKALRQTIDQKVRGSVRVNHRVVAPVLPVAAPVAGSTSKAG